MERLIVVLLPWTTLSLDFHLLLVADLASSVAKKTADCETGGAAFVRALSHHGNAEAN